LDKEGQFYDLILTSETLYNVQSHLKLYQIIEKHLKPTGMALIASKTYYFGKVSIFS